MAIEHKIIWTHVIILLLSIPLALRMVRRNRFYGLRVRKTLESDSVWYPANQLAGRLMVVGSLLGLAIVGCVESGLLPALETHDTWVSLVPTILGGVYSIIWAIRQP